MRRSLWLVAAVRLNVLAMGSSGCDASQSSAEPSETIPFGYPQHDDGDLPEQLQPARCERAERLLVDGVRGIEEVRVDAGGRPLSYLQHWAWADGTVTQYQSSYSYLMNGLSAMRVRERFDKAGTTYEETNTLTFEHGSHGEIVREDNAAAGTSRVVTWTGRFSGGTSVQSPAGWNRPARLGFDLPIDLAVATLMPAFVFEGTVTVMGDEGVVEIAVYDAAGRMRLRRAESIGVVIEYVYDGDGRLKRENWSDGHSTEVGYDDAGRIDRLKFHDVMGVSIERLTYDESGQLLSADYQRNGSQTIATTFARCGLRAEL